MLSSKKALLIVFTLLSILDLYNCTIPGQEFSIWLRPILMLILLCWILLHGNFSRKYLLISFTLLIAVMTNYLFFKNGASSEKINIVLAIFQYTIFLILLYQNIKNSLHFSMKLIRWASNYIFIFIVICFMLTEFENWTTYVLAIQSGIILLFISLHKNNSELFRQLYFGFCLIIMSLIFSKILMSDPRWFIEVLARFSFILGHFLFISGLAKIKLSFNRKNILIYQTTEKP